MRDLAKHLPAFLLLGACLSGCASSIRDDGETAATLGVVQKRFEFPKESTYWNRDYARAMTGAVGLMLVDAIYTRGGYFDYEVLLEDGRTVTLWNAKDLAVGSCVNVWLKRDPAYREGHYSQKYNDVEPSNGCKSG